MSQAVRARQQGISFRCRQAHFSDLLMMEGLQAGIGRQVSRQPSSGMGSGSGLKAKACGTWQL